MKSSSPTLQEESKNFGEEPKVHTGSMIHIESGGGVFWGSLSNASVCNLVMSLYVYLLADFWNFWFGDASDSLNKY